MTAPQPPHPHTELVSTLDEFYSLLATLGAIQASEIIRPDPSTGKHANGALNTQAASAAGYDSEAIEVMRSIPYVTQISHEILLQLVPNTYPITYLGADLDEGYFRDKREMLQDAEMPPTALRLTWNEIYGFVFIYDCASKLMVAWEPWENPDDVIDFAHVPALTPREVLGPVIEDYRRLKYIATPHGVDFVPGDYVESGGVPPMDWSPEARRRWQNSYNVWKAAQQIREIFLECGWDTEAMEQTTFRRDEFMEKRDRYWEEVVEPLIIIEQNN